jgi:undecaprenyl-diphosphatase
MTAGTDAVQAPARARAARRFSFSRHPTDVLRLGIGTAILLATAVSVDADTVGVFEENLFRLINDIPLPPWLWPVVWLLMQLGVIGVVPVTAGLAAVTRRWRLAFDFAVAGGTIYVLAKVIKFYVQRGRPAALLDDVHIHGEPAGGLGYVSGHSAVAVALATVAGPYLGRRGRRVVWALALFVCVSRVWVGAHLPFDVIGGAALGWLAGVTVHLVLGAPGGRPSTKPVRKAIEEAGLDPIDIEQLAGVDTRRAVSYRVATAGGRDLIVKYIPAERRDYDTLTRLWRGITRQGEQVGPPPQQVQHEALMALLAGSAGARVAPVVLTKATRAGSGLFAQEWIPGRSLAELGPGGGAGANGDGDAGGRGLDDDLLAEVWAQVAALRKAGIAHGDLVAASVVVDEDGAPWLVDFSHAHANARAALLDRDVADLLISLAGLVGPARAVASARAGLGADATAGALAPLRTGRVGQDAARELRGRPDLRAALVTELEPGLETEPA